MCLAVPAQVISLDDFQATVVIGEISRNISIWLTPEVRVGDFVLIHTGHAISIIDEDEARLTLELLHEIADQTE